MGLRLKVPVFNVETSATLLRGIPWRLAASFGGPIMHVLAAISHGGIETAPVHLLSYRGTLARVGCEEIAEAKVRKRRNIFAGLVARTECGGLPNDLLFGELPRSKDAPR